MRLRRRLAAVLLALALATGALGSASAQSAAEVFAVTVPVDATGQSAAAARESARADGQRRAFRQLLERLTPASEHRRLPRVDDATLSNMVQNFEVANERASSVRYLADYTFRFRPEDVRNLLRGAGIPFAETPSKPVLVLPVFVDGGTPVLFEQPTPWRQAWAERKGQDGLVPLVVPAGDAADVAAVDGARAVAGAPDALAALAQRYGADDVVVAQATPRDPDMKAVEVVAKRYGPGQPGTVVSTTYRANANEAPEDFLGRVAAAIQRDIEESWKKDTVLRFGQEGKMTVVVPVHELGDWVGVRERLSGVAAIRRTDVLAMSRSQVRLELSYVGDPSQLRVALAQRDLTLSPGDPDWTLSRRAAAARPR